MIVAFIAVSLRWLLLCLTVVRINIDVKSFLNILLIYHQTIPPSPTQIQHGEPSPTEIDGRRPRPIQTFCIGYANSFLLVGMLLAGRLLAGKLPCGSLDAVN